MKSGARLPPWKIALLIFPILLPLANPYIYTDFHAKGLLYSINLWLDPVLFSSLLGPVMTVGYARSLRTWMVRAACYAACFELLILTIYWFNYMDGVENFQLHFSFFRPRDA